MKSVLETADLAREVRQGSLVGVLRSFQVDAFEWKATPTCVNERHPLKKLKSWLTALEADAAFVTDFRWIKWVAPDQTVAVVLEPDC